MPRPPSLSFWIQPAPVSLFAGCRAMAVAIHVALGAAAAVAELLDTACEATVCRLARRRRRLCDGCVIQTAGRAEAPQPIQATAEEAVSAPHVVVA